MTAPISVRRDPGVPFWYSVCRPCGTLTIFSTRWEQVLHAGLRHLRDHHACPNARVTGEACDTACIHCAGRGWVE